MSGSLALPGEGTSVRPDRRLLAALAALLTLLAAVLFYPDAFADVGFFAGPFWISPLEFVFVVTVPAVAYYVLRNAGDLDFSALDALLLTLLGYIAIRGLFSIDNAEELGRVFAYPAYVLVFYYGAACLAQRYGVARVIFSALVVIGTVVIAYAFIEYFLNRNILFSEITRVSVPQPPGRPHYRVSSTLGHPAVLGLFIVQVTPFFVFFFASTRTVMTRLFWGLLVVLCSVALEITFTRGAGIAAAAVSALFMPIIFKRSARSRLPGLLLLLAIVAGLAGFTLLSSDEVGSGLYSEARMLESTNTRLYMWDRVPDAFSAEPWFGVGIWKGVDAVASIRYNALVTARTGAIDNIYMTFLVEQGLAGSLLMAAVIALLAAQAFSLLRRDVALLAWTAPLAAGMTAVLINGMTFDTLMIRHNTVLFWFMAGLMRAIYSLQRRT